MKKCECEHVCHFEDDGISIPICINGKVGHKYGIEMEGVEKVMVDDWGAWELCKHCREVCMNPYYKEENLSVYRNKSRSCLGLSSI